jgi:hypothetical protein
LRIDRTHRNWILGSLAGLMLALLVYIHYSGTSGQGMSGGSALGITYGSIGSAFMLFAGLLGPRKKFSTWRLGCGQSWLRAHLWLGTLSFPLILFHAGFHFGVGLTKALMWMFVVVFVSGIVGAVLQHYMPQFITNSISRETIYEQIGRVRSQLAKEASTIVDGACPTHAGLGKERRAVGGAAGTMGRASAPSGVQFGNEEACFQLQNFFQQQMRPFITHWCWRRVGLADPQRSQEVFQQLKALLPPNLHVTVDDLEDICEEKRDLDRQTVYHCILHYWLLIHIPFSYALLLLGAVHAVVALRY